MHLATRFHSFKKVTWTISTSLPSRRSSCTQRTWWGLFSALNWIKSGKERIVSLLVIDLCIWYWGLMNGFSIATKLNCIMSTNWYANEPWAVWCWNILSTTLKESTRGKEKWFVHHQPRNTYLHGHCITTSWCYLISILTMGPPRRDAYISTEQ